MKPIILVEIAALIDGGWHVVCCREGAEFATNEIDREFPTYADAVKYAATIEVEGDK